MVPPDAFALPSEIVANLCEMAQTSAQESYSPYSHYKVGVAIYAGDQYFVGTNVENISFPTGVCAERIAMGAVVVAGLRKEMKAIALYGESDNEPFTNSWPLPCGMCLQWLSELAPEIDVFICHGEEVERLHLRDLLPRPFGRDPRVGPR
jgi:cytidine deaminase